MGRSRSVAENANIGCIRTDDGVGGPSSKPPRPPRPPCRRNRPCLRERPPNRPPPLPPMGGRILSVECEPFTRGRGRVGRSPVVVDSEMCDAATLGHARVGLARHCPTSEKKKVSQSSRVTQQPFRVQRELIGEMTVQKLPYMARSAPPVGAGSKIRASSCDDSRDDGVAHRAPRSRKQTRVGGFTPTRTVTRNPDRGSRRGTLLSEDTRAQ